MRCCDRRTWHIVGSLYAVAMGHIDLLYGIFHPIITFDLQSYLLYMASSFVKCFSKLYICPDFLLLCDMCTLLPVLQSFVHPKVSLILLSLSFYPSPSPLSHRAWLCSVHGPDSVFVTPLAIPVLKFQAEAKSPDGSQKSL